MACYRVGGKHFVAEQVLATLDAIRAGLPAAAPDDPDRALLDRFLAVALDKWDGKYTYLTYLGIDLFELTPDADGTTGRRQRDEWLRLLLADAWIFEQGALDGSHDWLPRSRPDEELVDKRLHLLAAALSPVLTRHLGAPPDSIGAEVGRLLDSAPARRGRALDLSMQPVYVVHDEHLFVRVLQSFEVTFAAMAAEIRDAIGAVLAGRADLAAEGITRCGDALNEARTLFSLLATMRPESFRKFRAYTVGASAIQSGNYKTFEALCSRPPTRRIQSAAFDAVPEVRDRVRNGWLDLTSATAESIVLGELDADGLAMIKAAARSVENVHQRWKQTHWKLAVRMIGEEVGTGYTVGVPYLKDAIDNRLFSQLSEIEGAARA